MASPVIEQVLKQLETLTEDELRQVRAAVDARLQAQSRYVSDEEFLQAAEAVGVKVTLPENPMTLEEYLSWKPVKLRRGESMSEMIVRERR